MLISRLRSRVNFSKSSSHYLVERLMFLFTVMDFNSSIALLLIRGNFDSPGHIFHYLNCQGERSQLFILRLFTLIAKLKDRLQTVKQGRSLSKQLTISSSAWREESCNKN